ncbi:hypothetical protein WD019_02220 [Fictibacillus sp. Mic-4]|uniref:hypothetical protein n=1 Tax=Fictibacillus sp. Mic-4 TaxID=3132826 RepID=UPI003CF6E7EB
MNLPTEVKIGAMRYSIELVPKLHEHRSLYGEVNYSQQTIIIADDISNQRQVNALFHELTHAILFETGDFDLCDDEEFVRRFSNLLTQIFADNEWLTKGVLCDGPTINQRTNRSYTETCEEGPDILPE